jgi:hypothetical protein
VIDGKVKMKEGNKEREEEKRKEIMKSESNIH